MAYLKQKVRTCLWFNGDGHEAAKFYVSLLPNSEIEGGHGEQGKPPLVIEFTLAGSPMMILNASGGPKPSTAASISVLTEDQDETDRLWAKLLADGGEELYCGWLTDRWGVAWQIVPRQMPEMLGSNDREAAGRAMHAMRSMIKLDIAKLEAAFKGEAP
jgi:predicted 3-demethylubiquinone-9 3-methyltransferase (glyoxalase superfamily)